MLILLCHSAAAAHMRAADAAACLAEKHTRTQHSLLQARRPPAAASRGVSGASPHACLKHWPPIPAAQDTRSSLPALPPSLPPSALPTTRRPPSHPRAHPPTHPHPPDFALRSLAPYREAAFLICWASNASCCAQGVSDAASVSCSTSLRAAKQGTGVGTTVGTSAKGECGA